MHELPSKIIIRYIDTAWCNTLKKEGGFFLAAGVIASESHISSHQSRFFGNCAPQNTIGHVTEATSVQHDARVLPSLEGILCIKY